MIKQKAPKDMMATEFVDELDRRVGKHPFRDCAAFQLSQLREMLNESDPTPFTPDQLAWMREEQRSGFLFAWCDKQGYIWCSVAEPSAGVIETGGWECAGVHGVGLGSFLRRILSADDSAPLCFADFAPIDNESTVS